MPRVSDAKTWALRSGHGLNGLRRFEAAEAAFSPTFNRRRVRMLRLGAGLILFSAIPWTLYFSLSARLMPALFELGFVAAALLVLILQRRELLRTASLLFTGCCALGIVGLALVMDVPTPAVPRSVHLLLIPLTVAGFFLLQNEALKLRAGLPIFSLVAFAVLSSSQHDFGFAPLMDDQTRGLAIWFVSVFTGLALYATLAVMLREARESSALEQAFAVAVAAGEIEVYLQPQCRADGSLLGAEALMRWHHGQRGFVPPAEFIPMAERSGLIIPAGEQLLSKVCSALQAWEGRPALAGLSLSVNISSAQLFSAKAAEQLIARVPLSVAQRGVIKFELTESVFVQDYQTVHAKMALIRARGIRIALDDFGTGFSSLNYLKQLPLDQLKVDQTFVRDLPGDANAVKIARTIVQLGQDLGLEVVAEGTETVEQVAALQAMGCAIFQGFLFSRPLPLEAFETMAEQIHRGDRRLAA